LADHRGEDTGSVSPGKQSLSGEAVFCCGKERWDAEGQMDCFRNARLTRVAISMALVKVPPYRVIQGCALSM